jgi:hypothetical protein
MAVNAVKVTSLQKDRRPVAGPVNNAGTQNTIYRRPDFPDAAVLPHINFPLRFGFTSYLPWLNGISAAPLQPEVRAHSNQEGDRLLSLPVITG